jgi:outer membrane biosynthesis protein TonB
VIRGVESHKMFALRLEVNEKASDRKASSGDRAHDSGRGASCPAARSRLLRSDACWVTKLNPQYPPEAESQHIQGAVVLKVNIDKQGTVYKSEPISPLGFRNDSLSPR